MNFQINERVFGDVTVIELTGMLSSTVSCQDLCQCIKRLMEADRKRILVNLKRLAFIDSAGVGELIAGLTTVRKGGGTLKIVNATDTVSQVLKIVKLPMLIECFESEEEALTSFC